MPNPSLLFIRFIVPHLPIFVNGFYDFFQNMDAKMIDKVLLL